MKTFMARQAGAVWVALLVSFLSNVCPADAAEAAGQRPVRLALLESTNAVLPPNALVDLLAARLSATDRFELVERAALDAILRELSLSAASLSKSAEAVRVGRMLKADWFLLLSYPAGMTNAMLAKILDASTGVIRDLQVMPLKPDDPAAVVEPLAAFAVASKNRTTGLGGRLWIGFGGFEDLGLYHRYRDFGERLRTAMAVKYAGTRVSVVERSQMTPLLEELQLSLGGFTEVKTNRPSAQPAFVLVDGMYQAFRDAQSKINLVLRMEWIGGRRSAVSIKELPGAPLEAKVAETIDRFLAESPVIAATNSPTRRAERQAQLSRGRELARMPGGYFIPPDGVFMWSVYPSDRAPRVREAINAFESALFLDPENLEAKFGLAGCLADPLIDQLEKARDFWREIAVGSTNALAVSSARASLAFSYIERDDLYAYELISALRNATTDLDQRASLNNKLSRIGSRLGNEGRLTPQRILEFATDSWRGECRLAEQRLASTARLDVYRTFTRPQSDFAHAFSGKTSTQDRREYIGVVVSNLVNEFPRFQLYLVSGYARGRDVSPFWKAWHERILRDCEEHPDQIVAPTSYYTACLMSDLRSFIDRQEYELADRVARMFEKSGRNYFTLQANKDELDFLIGHVRFKLKRFDEAIAAFERIGPRQVSLGQIEDVWGKTRFISGVRAAAICREQVELVAKPAGTARSQSIKPVQVFGGAEVTFAIDGPQIWLADRIGFHRYRIQSGELERVPAPVNPRVHRMLVHQNKIWLATSDGLYAFNPSDNSVVSNTVTDGLLMPGVTALAADADRLWTGFGGRKENVNIGGLGYLNLSDNRFVGLMSELPTTPGRRSPRLQSEGAQRRYITGLAVTPSRELWVSTSSGLLRYKGPGADGWEVVIPRFSAAVPANVAANADYVVVPCYEPVGWSSDDTNFGGVFVYDIRKKSHRRLTNTEGLPNNKLYSTVIEGPKAWLGGVGFLAAIDLPSGRLDKVFPLPSAFPVRSLAVAGNDLWFSSGPGLYRISKDADATAAPAGSGTTVPEITDMRAAHELLKKRDAAYRIYGTSDTPEVQEMTAQFNAFIRRAAKDFPLLEPAGRKGTNHFIELTLNKHGRGMDGFRFRGTLQEPADFGWIFALEQVSAYSWFIASTDDASMKGFTDFYPPKIAYTNAPWTGLTAKFSVHLQFLHDGQILPGKEYIIWLDLQNEQPLRFFVAFDLFPASARHRSRSVLEGTFGLGGPLIPGR
jgi:hypothetical protein